MGANIGNRDYTDPSSSIDPRSILGTSDRGHIDPTGRLKVPELDYEQAGTVDPKAGVIQDVLERLVGLDEKNLTPQQMIEYLKKEQAIIERAFPNLPQLEEPGTISMEDLSNVTSTVKKAALLYAMLGQFVEGAEGVVIAEAEQAKADAAAKEAAAKKAADEAAAKKALEDAIKSEADKRKELGMDGAPGAQGSSGVTTTNSWFTGSMYTALNVAIQQFARAMSQLSQLEAKAARETRTAEIENVASQVQNIQDEANRKKALMMAQAITKLVSGVATVLAHAGMAAKSGGDQAAAIRFQTHMSTVQNLIGNVSETTQKWLEASAQTDLAGYEARKVVQRDQYEALKKQGENASRYAAENRDQLMRLLDQLGQSLSEVRRSLGLGRG